MFPKGLVPQADSLAVVDHVLDAIASGGHADADIVPSGYTDRQGRYYRLAAEGLGLAYRSAPNHADLTSRGRAYVAASRATRRLLLRELAISENPFLRGIVNYLGESAGGRGRDDIIGFIVRETALSEVTAERRYTSVHNWLLELGLAEDRGGRLVVTGPGPGFGRAEVASTESILEGLPAYSRPATASRTPDVESEPRLVAHLVDEAKLERANAVHEMLRQRIAENAGNSNYVVRPSGYIDVYAARTDREVIFEVKSATEANFMKQVRSAVSQLHEYRYYQDLHAAELCLVIEAGPPPGEERVLDYLYSDRGIAAIHLNPVGRLIEPPGYEGAMAEFVDS